MSCQGCYNRWENMQIAYKQKLVNKVYWNMQLSKECLCVHVERWEGFCCFLYNTVVPECRIWCCSSFPLTLNLLWQVLQTKGEGSGLVSCWRICTNFSWSRRAKALSQMGHVYLQSVIRCKNTAPREWAFYIVILRESSKNIQVFRNYHWYNRL